MHSALGIRVHSGWSAVVAVCGAPDSVQVIDRRRIECVDPSAPGVKQPYHFVEAMDLPAAEEHLARCRESSIRMATQALSDAVRQLDERGFRAAGAAILEASGRTLPALAGILASHALIHTAEGEFFRAVFRQACENLGIPVTGVRERDLETAPLDLREAIACLGRKLGPPWTQDQKIATLAACQAFVNLRTVAPPQLR